MICYKAQQRHQKMQCENKSKTSVLRNDFDATFNHALITCSSGCQSIFAGNSALLPSVVIDFAMLHAQRLLTRNSFIVRCHVTLKYPMRVRAVGEKNSSYIKIMFIEGDIGGF